MVDQTTRRVHSGLARPRILLRLLIRGESETVEESGLPGHDKAERRMNPSKPR